MQPTDFFGSSISDALSQLKIEEDLVTYDKIEGDEFIELPEKGFYLQAKRNSGIISDVRIFFEEHDGFFPSTAITKGEFSDVSTISDLEITLGAPVREIRSMTIPGAQATLPGKQFKANNTLVSAHTMDGSNITFLHIRAHS